MTRGSEYISLYLPRLHLQYCMVYDVLSSIRIAAVALYKIVNPMEEEETQDRQQSTVSVSGSQEVTVITCNEYFTPP